MKRKVKVKGNFLLFCPAAISLTIVRMEKKKCGDREILERFSFVSVDTRFVSESSCQVEAAADANISTETLNGKGSSLFQVQVFRGMRMEMIRPERNVSYFCCCRWNSRNATFPNDCVSRENENARASNINIGIQGSNLVSLVFVMNGSFA